MSNNDNRIKPDEFKPACANCVHRNVCLLCANMSQFMSQFSTFWTKIEGIKLQPIETDSGRFLAKHCRFHTRT